MIFLILTIFAVAPDILPHEVEWLNDPNVLPTLFEEWETDGWYPEYVHVLSDNWLQTDRTCHNPQEIEGTTYNPWTIPRAWSGDIKPDGIVDMRDFGVLAKYHNGGMYKPKPPAKSNIEIMAELMKIFMEVK